MTTIKTQDLEGAALDWAVAQVIGKKVGVWPCGRGVYAADEPEDDSGPPFYSPSTKWGQGGPLIEEWGVELETAPPWSAYLPPGVTVFGSTALEAACRAVVASVYGDQVDVPDELVAKKEWE